MGLYLPSEADYHPFGGGRLHLISAHATRSGASRQNRPIEPHRQDRWLSNTVAGPSRTRPVPTRLRPVLAPNWSSYSEPASDTRFSGLPPAACRLPPAACRQQVGHVLPSGSTADSLHGWVALKRRTDASYRRRFRYGRSSLGCSPTDSVTRTLPLGGLRPMSSSSESVAIAFVPTWIEQAQPTFLAGVSHQAKKHLDNSFHIER